jgi:hypothetical protein
MFPPQAADVRAELRSQDQWNRYRSWDNTIPVEDQQRWYHLCLPPNAEQDGFCFDFFKKVEDAVKKYFLDYVTRCLSLSDDSFLIQLRSDDNALHPKGRQYFTLPQELSTRVEYASYFSKFILYLIRLQNLNGDRPFEIKDEIVLNKLRDALVEPFPHEHAVNEAIHSVFFAYLIYEVGRNANIDQHVYQFVVLSNVNSDGSKNAKGVISTHLAMIKMLIRSTILCQVFPLTVDQRLDSKESNELLQYSIEAKSPTSLNTPYAIVCQELGRVTSAIYNESHIPQTIWLRNPDTNQYDFVYAIVDNIHISLNECQRLIESVIQQLTFELQSLASTVEFKWTELPQVKSLVDDFHNREPGYSFMATYQR